MVKYITALLVVLALYLAWPYACLYLIDKALMGNEVEDLNRWIDLQAVRIGTQQRLEHRLNDTLGTDSEGLVGWVKNKVSDLGEHAIDERIGLAWVRNTLTSRGEFRQQMTHAYFESPTAFMVRLGDLGRDPIHVRMTLHHGIWRIKEVYP